MHRFLQCVPSWFLSGQVTSLFASVMEKELVKAGRGGIVKLVYETSRSSQRPHHAILRRVVLFARAFGGGGGVVGRGS